MFLKKTIKCVLSLVCVFALICSVPLSGSAGEETSRSRAYNYNVTDIAYVTPVENQGSEDDCIVYALLSAAGSYCLKNNVVSKSCANFSERNLLGKVGDSTNFGNVMYSAVKYDLGSSCFLTKVENTGSRSPLYLKHCIIQCGAVVAAFAIPAEGMQDPGAAVVNYSGTGFEKHHAVSIVGWNDNMDGGKGAWLCKNSYGKDWGIGGFFWLSYDTPFLYSAAVEVSRFSSVLLVDKTKDRRIEFGSTGAVGFRFGKNLSGAEISITAGGNTVTVAEDVAEGYNVIVPPSPMNPGIISLSVNGTAVSPAAINAYTVPGMGTKLRKSTPFGDENWLMHTDKLKISGNTRTYFAFDEKGNSHGVVLNAVDNRYYVTPADGFFFDENTEVLLNLDAINEELGYENDQWVKPMSESEGTKDDVILLSDGRLRAPSFEIGGFGVTRIDVETDSESRIAKVLYYQGGQAEAYESPDITLYKSDCAAACSLENPGEQTEFDPDLDYYYAVIDANGKRVSSEVKIRLNGEPVDADIILTNSGVTIGIVIDIPSVEETITESLNSMLQIFARLLNIFTGMLNRS